jgi:hypothetical protein
LIDGQVAYSKQFGTAILKLLLPIQILLELLQTKKLESTPTTIALDIFKDKATADQLW